MIEQFNLANNPCYNELVNSEKNYLNNFLFYLNEEDINELLLEFDNQHNKIISADANQEKLRIIYNHLKHLRIAQRSVLSAFEEKNPDLWLKSLNELYQYYEDYFSTSHHFSVPKEIDNKFKEIQNRKNLQGLPSPGSLGAILIAPIQRFPRYMLLAKELLKHIKDEDESAILLKEKLTYFIQGLILLNQRLNQHMLMLDQEIVRKKFLHLESESHPPVHPLLALSEDLCLLESEELIRRLNNFNFSQSTNKEVAAIRQAKENKFTLLLSKKVQQDKHPDDTLLQAEPNIEKLIAMEDESASPYLYLSRKPL